MNEEPKIIYQGRELETLSREELISALRKAGALAWRYSRLVRTLETLSFKEKGFLARTQENEGA